MRIIQYTDYSSSANNYFTCRKPNLAGTGISRSHQLTSLTTRGAEALAPKNQST